MVAYKIPSAAAHVVEDEVRSFKLVSTEVGTFDPDQSETSGSHYHQPPSSPSLLSTTKSGLPELVSIDIGTFDLDKFIASTTITPIP